MSYDFWFGIRLLLLVTGFIGLFICLTISRVECEQQASAMHLQSEFGVFKGCIFHLKDGRIVPAQNYIVNDSNK